MRGGDFPHIPLNNARAISWGSCDSAQFSCCLPGDEIRFHRLRAQSHPTSLHPTGQSQVLSSTSARVLGRFSRVGPFATLYTAAHQAPPSVRFSRQEYFTTSTTWETLRYCSPAGCKSSSCVSSLDFWLLPRLPVYYKGCKATARWRDTQGKIPNTGASVLLEFGAQLRGYGSSLVPQPGNSLKPILLGFYRGSSHRHDSWYHWPSVMDLTPSPSQGVDLKVLTFYFCLVALATSPQS